MSTSYKLSAAAFWKVYFTHLFINNINNARITNSVEISLCNQYKFRNYLQKLKG